MYYEVKAKKSMPVADGMIKRVTLVGVADCVFFSEAEKMALMTWEEADVFAVYRSKLVEIVNGRDSEVGVSFVATIAKTYLMDNGKESVRKYKVLVFAKDIDTARTILKDYMAQGLEDMELIKLEQSKIGSILCQGGE